MDDPDDLRKTLERAADVAQLRMLERQLAERDKHALETDPSLTALLAKLDRALAELSQRTK